MTVVVEACVDTLRGALAAERAGAGRLELCAALSDGGTTPSQGLIEAVCSAVKIPVMVLVRVRGGDFVYAEDEVGVMRRDAANAARAGAGGVVIGALTVRGEIDAGTTLSLVDAAGGCDVTFHRAIDFAPDPVAAIDTIAELGITTILSSGGAQTALEGAPTLARMIAASGSRIQIMAGGGITESNASRVIQATGAPAIHVRCAALQTAAAGGGESEEPRVRLRKPLPADERAWEDSSEARIRQVVIAAGAATP
jgi:copper homeostasis protein